MDHFVYFIFMYFLLGQDIFPYNLTNGKDNWMTHGRFYKLIKNILELKYTQYFVM